MPPRAERFGRSQVTREFHLYSPEAPLAEAPEGSVECFVCTEPIRAFCIFSCGHYCCYSCGLRIHTVNKGGCPVCRVKDNKEPPIISRSFSKDEEQYSTEEMAAMRTAAVTDRRLTCVIDGPDLASEVAKLYEFFCPLPCCWQEGLQDPFYEFASLCDHMRIDHKLNYCTICLEHRSAFLCEQSLYGKAALTQHHSGFCPFDSASFMGHPPCKFCSKKDQVRFYDGEGLLSHMQKRHFTCDVCNKGQYTFTFYDNRAKLNLHFEQCHKICDHADCQNLDLMLRVFASDFDLAIHRQRVHGMKVKLVLNQGSLATGGAEGGSANGGGTGLPSTGSNTNVIQITFDHVFRRETVEMLPTKGRPRRRPKPADKDANLEEQVFVPGGNGLPAHYHHARAMKVLIRPSCTSSGQPSQQRQHHNDPHPQQRTANTAHAFGISESTESYNVKNRIPSDPREQQRQLNELLTRELTSPVAYAHFRSYTKEFMDARILTSKYYDLLTKEIFPDKRTFQAVFPLLVATVPNADRKTALQEIHKMRMAPEWQRLERVQEEEERAKEAEEEKARQIALWQQLKAGKSGADNSKKTRNAAKQNAWFSAGKQLHATNPTSPNTSHGPGTAGATLSGCPGGSSPSSAQGPGPWTSHALATAYFSPSDRGAPASFQVAGNVWDSDHAGADDGGGGGLFSDSSDRNRRPNGSPSPAAVPAVPLSVALGSDDFFPSLPNNAPGGGRGRGKTAKASPQRANAWFQNR